MSARGTLSHLTRRQWAALMAVAPIGAQVTSTKPPQGTPAPAKPAATPEQKLQKAYADIRAVSASLSKTQVPMDLEPAFSFRA